MSEVSSSPTNRAGRGGRTLLDKIWLAHQVEAESSEAPGIVYVDLHLVHEVIAAAGLGELAARGLQVFAGPERTLATMDHSVPTPADAPERRRSLRHR